MVINMMENTLIAKKTEKEYILTEILIGKRGGSMKMES